MPTYTYNCSKCKSTFELFSTIKDYCSNPACLNCNSKETSRDYICDVLTLGSSVKKGDTELRTLGDLALRNTERMSDDEKTALYIKHNSYKENIDSSKPLPNGMTRIKKTQKIKWPGSKPRKRRDIKK